jgi:hypothetical protein
MAFILQLLFLWVELFFPVDSRLAEPKIDKHFSSRPNNKRRMVCHLRHPLSLDFISFIDLTNEEVFSAHALVNRRIKNLAIRG